MHGRRCLCGAVTFQISAEPISARACWRRLCQYIGGGIGTVNVAFRSEVVSIAGEVGDHADVADSGTRMHRLFCKTCGTPLFSTAESRPHLSFVRAGARDDPEIGRPVAMIWTAEAPSWACFDPESPQLQGQPAPVA
jgi:hypothetical protein